LDKNILWESYKHDIDTHKGYLDLAIKLNIFYYAITGAIISFYFLHVEEQSLVKFSLVLPIMMSLGLTVFLWKGADASKISHQNIEHTAAQLGFQTFSAIAAVLELLLRIFSVLLLLTFLGLSLLFLKNIGFSICVTPALSGGP